MVISEALRCCFVGYRRYLEYKSVSGSVAEGEDNLVGGRQNGVAEDRQLEAVCDHYHHGKVTVPDSMIVASERLVELVGDSCANVVRRLAACATVEAARTLQASHA